MGLRIPFLPPPLLVSCMADGVALAAGSFTARRALPTAAPAGAAPAWQAMLLALRELLDAGCGGARRARIVLSDRFVHYCLIPAAAGIARADEAAAYARHAFRGEYGAAVESWRVCVDSDAAGTGIAVLIEGGLRDALTAACGQAGLRVDSIAPHFAAAQAALASRMPPGDAWFAVHEPGHLCAALHAGGTWQHWLSARLAPASALDGAALVAALEAQSIGMPAARAVRALNLVAAPQSAAALQLPAGWRMQRWVDPCVAAA